MAELNVQQQNIIKQLKQTYPELKNYSDTQILSLYNQQLNNVQLTEAERISIMNGRNGIADNGMGLKLETSQTSVSKEQEEQLKSALTARLNAVSTNVKKAEDSNGVIGSIWSWSKNNIPFLNKITDSSDKVREQQKADLKALESSNIAETFKKITGLDYTVENVNKFLNNEVQTKSETALNGYTEGQKMALDVGADMISGVLAVGALALAPVTGGASILLAAGVGAATKVTIKALAPGEYSMKDLAYDTITGSINGALAPLTNGLGGAVGTGVAKLFGLEALESTAKTALSQAVKHAGKEVVEEIAEEAVEQGGKSLLTKILAKQGSEYVLKEGAEKTLKTTIGKVTAYTADMMVDGSLSGAGDGIARALAEGRFEDIPQDMLQGFIGGAIASPFIGGGFRLVGKASSTVLNKINSKITFSSVLPDGTSTKFGQGEVGDCPLLSMIDGFLANDRTKGLLTNAIQTDVNGNFAVKIGDKTVTVLRSSLTNEMLSNKTGIRIFEQAYKQVAGDLDGVFADDVAKHFGLTPLHITSDNITDEVLERIAKDSDNYVLSLGARINADGVVSPDGEFQHYFAIKNIAPKTKTVTLVDTYDTSKTLTMSFDDVKSQGISIDGGSIGKTDLPNSVRNTDDVKFKGIEVDSQGLISEISPEIREKLLSLPESDLISKFKELYNFTNFEMDLIKTSLEDDYGGKIIDIIEIYGLDDIIGVLNNASNSRIYADIIQKHQIFDGFNLSYYEIVKIKNALETNSYDEIASILEKNNSSLYNNLNVDVYIHSHKSESALQSIKEQIKKIPKETSIPKRGELCLGTINGSDLYIKCSDDNITTRIERGVPLTSKNTCSVESLLKSNLITLEAIEVAEKIGINLNEYTVGSKFLYADLSVDYNIGNVANKLKNHGIESLTTHEIHALTDFFKALYKNATFKDNLDIFCTNNPNINQVRKSIAAIDEIFNSKLGNNQIEIESHFVARMIDRNYVDLLTLDNDTFKKQIIEQIKDISKNISKNISGNSQIQIIVNGNTINIKIKKDGCKIILDTII